MEKLYIAILIQALRDIKIYKQTKNRVLYDDLYSFFNSEWFQFLYGHSIDKERLIDLLNE